MRVGTKALVLGLSVGAAGIVAGATPPGLAFDEAIGLSALFRLRGPVEPPADVVVVTIDRESARHFGLPNEPRKWPRGLHGQLVDALARAGAEAVAFDVLFDEPRDPGQDRRFARAVDRAGNVILGEYLKKESVPMGGGGTQVDMERMIPPIPPLREAAVGLAPFPLPKVPVRVSQAWLFKAGAGQAPTLPAVTFVGYTAPEHRRLLGLIQRRRPDLAPAVREAIDGAHGERLHVRAARLRRVFRQNPGLADALLAAIDAAGTTDRRRLSALVRLYSGAGSHYLNFYGPPRSIRTIPYHRVVDGAVGPDALAGKAVFVGFSEQLQPEQKDGFYTVYSQPDGLDVAGVEIAATTFANLLDDRFVRTLPPWAFLLVLALWGVLLGAGLRLLPARSLIPVTVLAVGGYVATGAYGFAQASLWIPMAVPVLVQAPLAVLGALLWRYRDTRRETDAIRRAFGYYLPNTEVARLVRDLGSPERAGQLVYGTCLATDAEQYTKLAEHYDPATLHGIVNRYYERLFAPVRQRGGIVSDVVGDAMLAIWATARQGADAREQACGAALEIVEALAQARDDDPAALPTRIGLHCGEIMLGHVGAMDHLEYRAVGDIVNTANRIQGLNKDLGTRVLASREMVEGLDGFVTRPLGDFLLAGKTNPLGLCELVGVRGAVSSDALRWCEVFGEALTLFRARQWGEARGAFRALLERRPQDGPARYFLGLAERYDVRPPEPQWRGVVVVGQK